jgi:hypothetical protein
MGQREWRGKGNAAKIGKRGNERQFWVEGKAVDNTSILTNTQYSDTSRTSLVKEDEKNR